MVINKILSYENSTKYAILQLKKLFCLHLKRYSVKIEKFKEER